MKSESETIIENLKIVADQIRHRLTAVPADIEGGNISYWHVCGECHSQIDPKFTFCPYCGREIQW